MSEMQGNFSFGAYSSSGWTQEQVNAHQAKLEEEERAAQAAARSRLPEFSGDDVNQKIIDTYDFIWKRTQLDRRPLHIDVYMATLSDLREAYPDILTTEVTERIYSSAPTEPIS